MHTKEENLKNLNKLFGSYRAEWLKEKIFDLFSEPSYFTALQDNRPFVLEGGRGTGKTTVLRGLSYQGQYALHKNDIISFDKNDFIGIYHRVNTNHVRAFIDGGLSEDNWKRVFSHYFNLIVSREILIFLKWHAKLNNSDEYLSGQICEIIAKSLCINNLCDSQTQLLDFLEMELVVFQSKINNLNSENLPSLSMAGDPIKLITENIIKLTQFHSKTFYLILDEYENFEDYQQQVINTLIKHNTDFYTFKIGVRELGWRIKHTLNPNELLHDPADYVLFPVEQKLEEGHFSEFAKKVCEQRIHQLFPEQNATDLFMIEEALGTLSIEDEALMLEVENTEHFKVFNDAAKGINELSHLSSLYKFFIAYWGYHHKMSIDDTIKNYLDNSSAWNTRYDNYKYEMLFKIRTGRGKRGIQKYYSGWATYVKLSQGNIRYLMELVYRVYEKHLQDDKELNTKVDVKLQTLAAQDVGLKNLMELEGLWKNGAKLTKLLLGFGRIFQVLSKEEGNSAPEQNQFSIENSESISDDCQEILTAAIMNLAIVRSPGNKLSDNTQTRDYLYTIHPIYSAYFCFSYRKKRKILVKSEDILGVILKPKETISSILKKFNIDLDVSESKNLPKQLEIFENYYND